MQKLRLVIIMFALLTAILCSQTVTAAPSVKSNPVTHLGNVDGIDYYIFNSTYMTWADADLLCKSSGFELASVNSMSQLSFFASVIPRQNGNYFWSAASDIKDLSIMRWQDGSRLSEDFFGAFVDPDLQKICGLMYFYQSGGRAYGTMDLVSCTRTERPMCQTTVRSEPS